MQKPLYAQIIDSLWNRYSKYVPAINTMFGNVRPPLDHLAILDLSRPGGGRPTLEAIMSHLELEHRGSAYLPDKQNPFSWMMHKSAGSMPVKSALPQVVVADFRNEELAPKVRDIIERYIKIAQPFDLVSFERNVRSAMGGDEGAAAMVIEQFNEYIEDRGWPAPTMRDYMDVCEQNQLLAWVLLFGRRVNHFGVAVYAMDGFGSLGEFNTYVLGALGVGSLNEIDGMVKGSARAGIEQSSTLGDSVRIVLEGGAVEVRDSFVEFVWRYPRAAVPEVLGDYFCDFVPGNANVVVESLYTRRKLEIGVSS